MNYLGGLKRDATASECKGKYDKSQTFLEAQGPGTSFHKIYEL
jgi:hypothetical protein